MAPRIEVPISPNGTTAIMKAVALQTFVKGDQTGISFATVALEVRCPSRFQNVSTG